MYNLIVARHGFGINQLLTYVKFVILFMSSWFWFLFMARTMCSTCADGHETRPENMGIPIVALDPKWLLQKQ